MERIRRFFKRFRKTVTAKGYTLIEVATVVAVTSTMTAVALPVMLSKIAEGKVQGAAGDIAALRTGIISFIKDTGLAPIYTLNRPPTLGLPKETDTNFYYALRTDDGKVPAVEGSGWSFSADLYGSLDGQLITNVPKYPTEGVSAWKGPYLPAITRDPWGSRYYVVVRWLAEPTDGKQKAVYILSAGPNGKIETNFEQPIRDIASSTPYGGYRFTVGGDDIVIRIQ